MIYRSPPISNFTMLYYFYISNEFFINSSINNICNFSIGIVYRSRYIFCSQTVLNVLSKYVKYKKKRRKIKFLFVKHSLVVMLLVPKLFGKQMRRSIFRTAHVYISCPTPHWLYFIQNIIASNISYLLTNFPSVIFNYQCTIREDSYELKILYLRHCPFYQSKERAYLSEKRGQRNYPLIISRTKQLTK